MTIPVHTRIENNVLHIEFNRPDKMNAITLEMYGLAAKAFEQANDTNEIRAIVLSGAGDCFTAGNDIMDFLSAKDGVDERLFQFLRAVPNCTKPIIAAVQGHAVGIGTTLLLHCDMVYVEENSRFQLPFVNLGLCPEFGSSLLLPQQVGHRRAAELLMLGETFNAETALNFGIINGIVSNAKNTAFEQANKLAQLPAAAIRVTKTLMMKTDKDLLMKTIDMEGEAFVERMHSPEAREALTAFMEKREPDFKQFD